MKTILIMVGIILTFNPYRITAMESASFSIVTNVISGGGAPMSSASFQTIFTLGQPSPITRTDSTNLKLNSGFWHTMMVKDNCIWDIYNDGDGDVDGLDLYRFLNPYGGSDLESFATEFGRTDCSN
ncbi:MAG: hypothetical protein QNK40_11500 [Desulfobacterales bacterium]|nr:hypothetical protein [Desulfobacterales bacterium]